MEPFIEYLPERDHAEKTVKEATKQKAHRLGLDLKTTTVSQLEEREASLAK